MFSDVPPEYQKSISECKKYHGEIVIPRSKLLNLAAQNRDTKLNVNLTLLDDNKLIRSQERCTHCGPTYVKEIPCNNICAQPCCSSVNQTCCCQPQQKYVRCSNPPNNCCQPIQQKCCTCVCNSQEVERSCCDCQEPKYVICEIPKPCKNVSYTCCENNQDPSEGKKMKTPLSNRINKYKAIRSKGKPNNNDSNETGTINFGDSNETEPDFDSILCKKLTEIESKMAMLKSCECKAPEPKSGDCNESVKTCDCKQLENCQCKKQKKCDCSEEEKKSCDSKEFKTCECKKHKSCECKQDEKSCDCKEFKTCECKKHKTCECKQDEKSQEDEQRWCDCKERKRCESKQLRDCGGKREENKYCCECKQFIDHECKKTNTFEERNEFKEILLSAIKNVDKCQCDKNQICKCEKREMENFCKFKEQVWTNPCKCDEYLKKLIELNSDLLTKQLLVRHEKEDKPVEKIVSDKPYIFFLGNTVEKEKTAQSEKSSRTAQSEKDDHEGVMAISNLTEAIKHLEEKIHFENAPFKLHINDNEGMYVNKEYSGSAVQRDEYLKSIEKMGEIFSNLLKISLERGVQYEPLQQVSREQTYKKKTVDEDTEVDIRTMSEFGAPCHCDPSHRIMEGTSKPEEEEKVFYIEKKPSTISPVYSRVATPEPHTIVTFDETTSTVTIPPKPPQERPQQRKAKLFPRWSRTKK